MPFINEEENKQYKKEYYLKNKNKYYDRNKKRREKVRDWFDEFKSKLKCEICNENHIACLDFHHKNPEEKDFTIGKMRCDLRSKEKFLEEIAKCQVLCSNCHRKFHYEERKNRKESLQLPT